MSTRGRREDDSPRTPYGAVAARPDPPYEILVDGHRIPAVPGQTVGAAMAAAGFRSWRTTRYGDRPRGLFCGIGVCFDCLVTVNGRPSVRACLVEAQQGDTVETQAGSGVGTWVGSARGHGEARRGPA